MSVLSGGALKTPLSVIAGIFKFTLMEIGNWVDADQSTGRVIHLPNSMIIHEVIANYSKGFEYIWNEIPVLVTLRYLIEPRKRRGSSQGVWEDILVQFAECEDIDFAYPTQRFYNNASEGKDGTIKTLQR